MHSDLLKACIYQILILKIIKTILNQGKKIEQDMVTITNLLPEPVKL